ncbi:S-layer homology domain-containing protein [Paenibacillus pasadenensis]|uniref:S-layer homology domain-containing protein n=1 Tax=Paenibacillus pasadenensis TaxID=217090 RepID=UPI0003F688C3|nr:S-layer homology domain-containing protein [Paenibacillus pasadenensis]
MKTFKLVLSCAIAAAILPFSPVVTSSAAPAGSTTSSTFKDVKRTDWFYGSVQKLTTAGLVNGFEDGTFRPQKEVSRAEFLKLVSAALKIETSSPNAGDAWYKPYVNAAIGAGIHKASDFNGNWTQSITRQEMARITVRAVEEKLRTGSPTDPQLVYEATKRGIISGLAGGELGLKEKSTRAQATVIIDRILTLLAGGILPSDKRAASYAEVAYTGTNVETMWGGKFRQLPFKAKIRNYINGEFKQILILDMDDKDSPYLSWLPKGTLGKLDPLNLTGITKSNTMEWKNEYMMAFKVELSNTKIVKDYFSQFRGMIGAPYFIPAINISSQKGPFSTEMYFRLDTINSKEMWVFYAIKKETVVEAKKYNAQYFYFETYGDDHYVLDLGIQDGRLFGGKTE